MQDYEYLNNKMKRARDEAAGKPLENNTRLYKRTVNVDGIEMEVFSVKLHNTFIVDRLPDGRAILYNGGWNTPTTADRVRTYGSNHVFSDGGNWYVWMRPNPKDPRPDWMRRSIPKPFEIHNPGPEPVKTLDGIRRGDEYLAMQCIAGTTDEEPWQDIKRIFDYEWEKKPASNIHVSLRYYSDGSGPYRGAHVAGIERSFYGETSYAGEQWVEFGGQYHAQSATIGDKHWDYKQCPHCRRFDAVHRAWSNIYDGDQWSRKLDTPAYKVMVEMLAKYSTHEAWREAYLTDLRAVRANNKALKEWEQRNRVAFYDGIIVDKDGYAERPNKKQERKLAKHEREVEKMEGRIDRFVKLCIDKLKEGLPMPSGGDCWYCCMVTTDTREGMGDAFGSHSHLMEHMKEKYVVPSMLVNALREAGYQDTGIYIWLNMNADTQRMGGEERLANYDTTKRALKKYLRKRLIPVATNE